MRPRHSPLLAQAGASPGARASRAPAAVALDEELLDGALRRRSGGVGCGYACSSAFPLPMGAKFGTADRHGRRKGHPPGPPQRVRVCAARCSGSAPFPTLRVWIWGLSWLPSLVVTDAAMTCVAAGARKGWAGDGARRRVCEYVQRGWRRLQPPGISNIVTHTLSPVSKLRTLALAPPSTGQRRRARSCPRPAAAGAAGSRWARCRPPSRQTRRCRG